MYLQFYVLALCGFVIVAADYELTIIHNNDVHAHFEQVNKYSGECLPEQAANEECYGGEARRNAFIKDARSKYPNTLVLDAGDRFTGTLWFHQYQGAAAATFVNMENYDAVCLGNHEFDAGVEGLVPYLQNLTVPVVDANIDVSKEPRLPPFNSTLIKEVGGVKVGIIGYITTDTAFISSSGPTIKFNDEVETVKREAKKLKDAGIEIVIGLCHAGYGMDHNVAAAVDNIDVIVGGHSHTFLYTGEKPSNEEIEGPYPTVVEQASGRKVLIVQAYAWGKYMGFLNVTFDDKFEVSSWSGQPVLLDKSIPRDPDTLKIINEMKKPLNKLKAQVVGRTTVKLEGDPIQCRLRECNSGNLLTDAMIEYHVDKRNKSDGSWGLAAIALLSGGGIRASTERGNITMGQVLTVQPFGNVIDMIQLRGVHLRQAFEHSVAKYDIHDRPGAFFQMSGAHVVYDLTRPSGDRVVSLELRCLYCESPVYEPINENTVYNILMMDFTIKGGDDFTVIRDNVKKHVATNSLDSDVFSAYLQKHNPVFADVEGRIKIMESSTTNSAQRVLNNSTFLTLLCLILIHVGLKYFSVVRI